MNELQKCAEILVEAGYASDYGGGCDPISGNEYWIRSKEPVGFKHIPVQVFVDTLEGRRQADAIEDWLVYNHGELWCDSECLTECCTNKHKEHQWRLDRIKWCIKEIKDT